MSDPKHATITTTNPQDDGSVIIDTKAYFEQLASHKEEREYRRKTNRKELLNDLLACVALILEGRTTELTINIKTNTYKEPDLISHRYTIYKESFNKRIPT